MNFKDYLDTFPSIEHVHGLDVYDEAGNVVHTIDAVEGKLGSLKLYHALAQQFNGVLNPESATQGIEWFAEHAADAQANAGKHPNIDLLFTIQQQGLIYRLVPRC